MRATLFRTRAAEVVATAAVVVSIASFALMHLLMSDVVDPVATPVSSYALTFPGIVLFPAGTLSLALACAVLAARGVGLPRQAFIQWLLGTVAVMLVLAASFRTGTPETGLTFGAQIHRYTAGAAFVMLTVAAGLCAARLREADATTAVRRVTWGATIAAALTFLTTTVNTFLPAVADGGDWRGIPQRVLLVVLTALVAALIANSRSERVPSPLGARARMAPRRDAVAAPALLASKS